MYSLRSRGSTPQQQVLSFPVRKRKQEKKVTEENTSPSKKDKQSVKSHATSTDARRRLSPTKKREPLCDKNWSDKEDLLLQDGKELPTRTFQKKVTLLQEAKAVLHSSTPSTLLCREKEIESLKTFLETHLDRHVPGSLYISGPPGTGKTASLTHILSHEKDLIKGVELIVLNCMSMTTPQSIFSKIAEELGIERKPLEKGLTEYIRSMDNMILLVLDEIDQLDCRGQQVLYTLFEWPALPNSHLVLIGIANSLDFTDRMLPRLQAHPNIQPELLLFTPYTTDQIISILQERLSHTSSLMVIDPMAIQFCARKVAAVHGDVRKALDICRRAVELVQTQEKCQKLRGTLTESSVPAKVTIGHISRVVSEVYEGVVKGGADSVPLQQKLVACSLLLMVQKKSNKEVTLGKLYSVYQKVCSQRQLPYESQSEFVSLLNMLEMRGVVQIKKSKEVLLHKVSLRLQERELVHVLQDQTLISSVLEKGLP